MRVVAIAALLLAAEIASAGAYTQEEADACTPDAFRLCSAHIPKADAVEACLRASRKQLSPECAAVFEPARKGRDARQQKRSSSER
jgi:hypothetical protein